MRTCTILFACVFLAAAAEEAESDRSPAAAAKPDPGLLDGAGKPLPSQQSLTAEEEAGLINKGRIAEETSRKAVGLREAGNPHIPVDFLVYKLEVDPEKEQVDGNLLRERMMSQIERRSPGTDSVLDEPPLPQDEEPVAVEPRTEAPSEGSDRRWVLLAVTGMCLTGAVVLFLLSRPKAQ